MHRAITLLALIWSMALGAAEQPVKMKLGQHWQFREVGTAEWLGAVVPGTVQGI